MTKNLDKITLKGVDIYLVDPPNLDVEWVGMKEPLTQLLAAWSDDGVDPPMQPRILGKPGVGKTSLAITAAKKMKQELYITQCTVDTKPEDLIVSPVIADNGKIRYMASPLVTAMVRGGVCLLDEGNRMSEKSWASIAPLLDMRRSVYSIVAGVEINGEARVQSLCDNERRRFNLRGPRIHSFSLAAGHTHGFPDARRRISHSQRQVGWAVR